ncbi:MAG: DUF692 family protein, partial [Neptunomonas phycophila]
PVSPDVWSLYQHTLTLVGDCPTLIERDGNIPPLATLLEEANQANSLRQPIQSTETSRELIV